MFKMLKILMISLLEKSFQKHRKYHGLGAAKGQAVLTRNTLIYSSFFFLFVFRSIVPEPVPLLITVTSMVRCKTQH